MRLEIGDDDAGNPSPSKSSISIPRAGRRSDGRTLKVPVPSLIGIVTRPGAALGCDADCPSAARRHPVAVAVHVGDLSRAVHGDLLMRNQQALRVLEPDADRGPVVVRGAKSGRPSPSRSRTRMPGHIRPDTPVRAGHAGTVVEHDDHVGVPMTCEHVDVAVRA